MWRLRLEAGDNAIKRLRWQLPDTSTGIVFHKEGDDWMLETPESSAEDDAHSALKAGNRTIAALNFASSLPGPYRELVPSSGSVVDENGKVTTFLSASLAAASGSAANATVTTGAGEEPTTRARTDGELILDLIAIVPEVEQVRAIWAKEPDGRDLYMIFEIVKYQLGDNQGIDNLMEGRSRFTEAVNAERHADNPNNPRPKPKMSKNDTVAWAGELIKRWLKKLAIENDVPIETSV